MEVNHMEEPMMINYKAASLTGGAVELSADGAELKRYVSQWSPYWELQGDRLVMRQPKHLYQNGIRSLSRQLLMFAMNSNKDLAILNADFPVRVVYAGRRFGPLKKEYEVWEASFSK
jgi:hypothetical protein